MYALILMTAKVWGGTLVVSDAPNGVSLAAKATARPVASFETAAFEWDPQSVQAVGAKLFTCEGAAATRASWTALLDDAEKSLSFKEYDKATATLSAAQERLPCVVEPLSRDLQLRWRILAGVLAAETGNSDGAVEIFEAVLSEDSSTILPGWSDRVTAAMAEAKISEQTRPRFQVSIASNPGQWTIDGLPVPRRVVSGVHVIQWQNGPRTDSWTVEMTDEMAFLHGPSAPSFPGDWEPRALSLWLAANAGRGTPVLVVSKGSVFSGTAGFDDFREIGKRRSRPKFGLGLALAGAGAGLGAGGGVGMAISANRADKVLGEMRGAEVYVAPDSDEFQAWESSYSGARAAYWGSAGAVLGGAVLAGLGGWLASGGPFDVVPVVSDGAVGVGVAGSF